MRQRRTTIPLTSNPPAFLVAALLAAASAAACGHTEADAPHDLLTSVDSSGAYPVVRNSGRAPRWSLEPLGTVGQVATMGDPAPDEFGRVSSVTTGPDDWVWIADRINARIKAFRPDGSLAIEVGREGEGPGEFGSIYSLAWVNELLLVLDLGNGRIAELSPEGEWLGTRRAPGRVSGSPAVLRFYPLTDTTVVQWSLSTAGGEARSTWVEHGPEGITGEWQQLASERPAVTTLRCDRPDGVISFFSIPFTGQPLAHPAVSGRTYMAWSSEYRIALVEADGDTTRVIERDWPGIAVTREEWERETAEFRAFRDEWPSAVCTPRDMERPDLKAALRNLLVDTEGRLWVEAVGEESTVWEVFDATGRLLGSVPGFAYQDRVAPSIRKGRIAWSSTDSLGVQYVHWGRIAGPVRFPV